MNLVNGEYGETINIADRGFQYGDGLFETLEVINSKPLFLAQHLCRLNAGCTRFKIPPPDSGQLAKDIKRVCKDAKQAVLKIIVTRGIGGRGYRQPDRIAPSRVVSLHPFPDYPPAFAQEGINVRFCHTRLGLNPALAGIKHLNRLEQILARAEWDDPNIQEGIMLDMNDHVIEGTMSNVFYVKNKVVHTAPLKFSGVLGIMRGIVKQLIAGQNLDFAEEFFGKDALLVADEIFVCNSLIGIWPVKQLGQVEFSIGPMTRRLQEALQQLKEMELNNAP